MMLILRDDMVVETFDSPEHPPDWIETIDVENQEYEFCDDRGQRYVGKIEKGKGWLSRNGYRLVPVGQPDPAFLFAFLARATCIEPGGRFSSLDDLKEHLTNRSTE